jgi:hypothetical protein
VVVAWISLAMTMLSHNNLAHIFFNNLKANKTQQFLLLSQAKAEKNHHFHLAQKKSN